MSSARIIDPQATPSPRADEPRDSLAAVLACWNENHPAQKMTVVNYYSRRNKSFSTRRPWTACVVPKSESVLFKTGDGVVRECKIEGIVSALETFCLESPSDQLVGWETMENVVETASIAHKACRKMGADVVYRSVAFDIVDEKPVDVESRFYESYPADENTMQVFRTRNGDKYAYVILMGKTAFVQTPKRPFDGVSQVVNSMMISAYTRGSRECPICQEERRDIVIGFACVMHPLCRDCYRNLRDETCPICRSQSFEEKTHRYMPRWSDKM